MANIYEFTCQYKVSLEFLETNGEKPQLSVKSQTGRGSGQRQQVSWRNLTKGEGMSPGRTYRLAANG